MLEAVFFDVGNTLLYPYPSVSEVCREVLLEAGHARELSAIDELMPLVDQYYEDRYREDDTFWTDEAETSAVWVGMYGLLCRRLGIVEDAERLARRVYDEFGDATRWRTYGDVLSAFGRIRRRGVKVGLVSNWDSRLRALVSGLGLDEYVEVVVCSADVGLRKPDPRIFELACKRLDVVPARAAHVGDHYYADVVGSKAVGMTPVLIDRHLGVTPEYVPFVRTLDDLDAVLGWGQED
jgi:putative hydrolase of the HAD superfamily